jgi:signal transduction histidine kinase
MISPQITSERYVEIANSLSQAWLLFKASGELLGWSPQILTIFPHFSTFLSLACSVESVLEKCALLECVTTTQKKSAIQRRLKHFQEGVPYQETRYYEPERVLEVQLQCLPNQDRLISFVDLSAFRDNEYALKVTNQELEARVDRRTQALTVAHEEAVHQGKIKGRFLAAVSHDLLQPINAARLFTASLQNHLTDKREVELTKNIAQSLLAADELIADLLDVSRLETGKLSTQVRPFVLSEVLKPLANEFQVLAEENGIDFRVQFSDLIGVSDPKLLRRALQNFLGNAFRYNPKGKVLLGIRRQKKSIRIEVWDNGDGIAEVKQAHIFNEFTRLESDVMDGGLGLGLAIAKGICRVLDHDLGLRSWPKQGSVFSIVLPLGIAKGVCPISEAISPYTLEGIKLLCVVDKSPWKATVHQWAKQWGAEIKVVSNSSDWAAVMRSFSANVVLWDGKEGEYSWFEQRSQCEKLWSQTVAFGIINFVGNKANIRNITHWSTPLKPLKLRLWLMQQKRANLVSVFE